MALTQSEILDLINEIQTGADYPADKMNPLLTNILAAAYGPLYVGTIPPGNTDDENDGYRPGSVGYDTVTERFYVCQSALSGNAIWILIPADANYQYKLYSNADEFIALNQNTSVFKADNTDAAINTFCYVLLPANPYTGKVIILYFQDAINDFFIKDSSGVVITSGSQIDIPAGQQYTITYNGVVWEIVGISNINPALASGVAVTKGATSVPNITAVNFIGSSVTVASGGGGVADVTITPLAGVNVTRGAGTTVTAAQTIDFSNNFNVSGVGSPTASISYLSRIAIEQDGTLITTPSSTIGGFDFKGAMLSGSNLVLNGSTAEITLNGAKALELFGSSIPTANTDSTQGYSTGSYARNLGDLKRSFICRFNAAGSAVWDRITEDSGYAFYNPISSGQDVQISYYVANVRLNTAAASTPNFTITVPRYAYVGKRLFIFTIKPISTLSVKGVGPQPFATIGNVPANSGIVMVCTDEGVDGGITQTWVQIG